MARLASAARARLADTRFLDRAPAHVVEQQRQRLAGLEQRLAAIDKNLADLQ
ncbi:MAG: hypothetical protein ACE5K7_03475 [Phycisphaerae bacterium]